MPHVSYRANEGKTIEIDADFGKGVREADAVAIHQSSHAVGHERSARGGRSQQASGEPCTFFVGEVHLIHRDRRRSAREPAEQTKASAARIAAHRVGKIVMTLLRSYFPPRKSGGQQHDQSAPAARPYCLTL